MNIVLGMKIQPKKIYIIFLLFAFLQTKAQKTGVKQNVLPPIKLKSAEDSVQYALGAYMGQFMLNGGFTTINIDLFLAGLDDVFKSKPRLLKDNSVYPIISSYQATVQKQRSKGLEEQLFAALKDKPGIGKLPSGVQYSSIKPGKGPRPIETDSIIINYKGTLADGTVFENTYLKNAPIATTPGTLIPGLNEVVQLMQPGATWQVFIPSAQAYADKGNGGLIPPNSALLITVELVEIKSRK